MKCLGSVWVGLLVFGLAHELFSQRLSLPERHPGALKGGEFVEGLKVLKLHEREDQIYSQIAQGNVPDFLRKLCPVIVSHVHLGQTNTATYFVTPDYLALGSDDDYFLTPLSPMVAQKIADLLGCVLPTRKMVDDIYAAAELKLAPAPIPPSPAMTTVEVFEQHNRSVRDQRMKELKAHPLGALVAGHKKDVVISTRLATAPGKVAIYGWHRLNGAPIQPLYTGHTNTWVDYSHGVRFVQSSLLVNGVSNTVSKVLANPGLARLLSDEGAIARVRYGTASATNEACPACLPGFQETAPLLPGADLREQILAFRLEPGVKFQINAPGPNEFDRSKPVKLIFYALPNGNTTEQTTGKKLKPGDDWHYDIQHIGAQTRFLREQISDYNWVVAYLENDLKSWPAWRKKHDPNSRRLPSIVHAVKNKLPGFRTEVILSGHSGGGSFIFGYINGVERIPDEVERITFLDSNYAYEPAQGHLEKLVQWLKVSERHFLSVLAYNDAVALLNGKGFVSAEGGTWGRSQLMRRGLGEHFTFAHETSEGWQNFSALDGRIKFILKENPDRVIFHTVQVERNGFIQSLLSGTPEESNGYIYFGPRAYTKWILAE